MDTIQEFKAHQNVFPGDQIRIETNIIKRSEDDIYFNARSYIDGKNAAKSHLLSVNQVLNPQEHSFTQRHLFTHLPFLERVSILGLTALLTKVYPLEITHR